MGNFQKICFVATSNPHILRVPKDDMEKKLDFLLLNAFLNSMWQEECIEQTKKKNACLEVKYLFPKV